MGLRRRECSSRFLPAATFSGLRNLLVTRARRDLLFVSVPIAGDAYLGAAVTMGVLMLHLLAVRPAISSRDAKTNVSTEKATSHERQ